MNQFTKEELKHMGDALLYGMAAVPERQDALLDIRGKVLNMIEDYIESTEPEAYYSWWKEHPYH